MTRSSMTFQIFCLVFLNKFKLILLSDDHNRDLRRRDFITDIWIYYSIFLKLMPHMIISFQFCSSFQNDSQIIDSDFFSKRKTSILKRRMNFDIYIDQRLNIDLLGEELMIFGNEIVR